MPDATSIRLVAFERDPTTDARSVTDIREFARPASGTPRTWSELSRDHDRRAMLLALVQQIDELTAGRIDEIVLAAVD